MSTMCVCVWGGACLCRESKNTRSWGEMESPALRRTACLPRTPCKYPPLLMTKVCKNYDESQALSFTDPREWTTERARAGCQREAGAWEGQDQTYISCQSLPSLSSVWFIRNKTKTNWGSWRARQQCGKMWVDNRGWSSSHPSDFHLRALALALTGQHTR